MARETRRGAVREAREGRRDIRVEHGVTEDRHVRGSGKGGAGAGGDKGIGETWQVREAARGARDMVIVPQEG